MKKLFFALLYILLFFDNMVSAQVSITTPYPAPAHSLTTALNSGLLTVEVQFTAPCYGATATIAFPASVTYVPGSVALVSAYSSAGFAVSVSNITNLNKPVFNLNVPAAGTLRFTLLRKAGCGAPVIGKDTVRISGSCGAATENSAQNSYAINSPVLSIVPPATLTNTTLGQTATRTISVTNGGVGCLDTLRLFVVYPSGGIVNTNSNQLSIGSTAFAPWRSNGDTLFYKFYGSALFTGDSLFCNGETVTITEPVKILQCNVTTTYTAYWGAAPAVACNGASGSAAISMASGTANFSANPVTTNAGYTNLCTPWTQRASFSNNGTGNVVAASMYNVKVSIEHETGGNLGSNLSFTFSAFNVNGQAVPAAGSNTTTYEIDLNNILTSDPDGAGGLEDIDGDGYYDDLRSGNTFVLAWTTQAICNLACGSDFLYKIGFRLSYKSMCGPVVASSIRTGSISVYDAGWGNNSYLPANIIGGVPFRFHFQAGYASNINPFFTASGRYQYRLVLPPGVSVAPSANAKYGTANATHTQSGDTLIITSSNNTLDTAGINLVLTCGSGGLLNFWVSMIKVNDLNNNCSCSGARFCTIMSTLAHCPAPCQAVTNYLPVVRRIDNCLGWTDHTLATRQSAANISAYDLSKALYLDTIQISGGAKQNVLSDNIHLRLSLAKTTLSPLNVKKLNPVDIKVEVWRLGILVFTCTQTATADSSTATMQEIDWNLCTPVGGLLPGDSVYTVSRYVVATNAGLPQQDVQSGNKWYYYNKIGTQVSYCDPWVPEMYLVGTAASSFPNSANVSGCTTLTPVINMTRRFNGSGTFYRNEFRPIAYIDSIVFVKANGYDYISATINKNSGPLGTPSLSVPLTPNLINGNKYTYINPGNWPFQGLVKATNYSGNFSPVLSTNCATQTSEVLLTKIYVRDYLYAFGGDPSKVPATYRYIYNGNTSANIASGTGLSYTLNYASSSKPNLVIQNVTGTVQGIKTNHFWDVKLSNTGTSTAGYIWLALEQGTGSGGIQIDSIIDLANNAKFSGEGAYACTNVNGYNWYKISTAGIASGTDANFRVHFRYSSCSKDSILIKAGWSCAAFPATPCTFPCAATQIYLTLEPQPSQLQLSMVRQPGGGAGTTMCVTDSTIFLINNAQSGYLNEPSVAIYPPQGVNLVPPVSVEYPAGSNTWYMIQPQPLTGGGYQLSFSSIAALNAGLPGTITNPATSGRQAKIKVIYSTTCDIVSGAPFAFYGYGYRGCGTSATGNGSVLYSSGVTISGATVPGSMGLSLSADTASLSCNDTVVITAVTVPVATATQPGDTVVHMLPAGLVYAGNFTPVANCTACEAVSSLGSAGNTIVKVKLEPGIAANTTISYRFDVTVAGEGCSNSPVEAYAKRQAAGLFCDTTPCTGAATVIGMASSTSIAVHKPEVTIINLQHTAGSWTVDSTVTVAISLSNTGTVSLTANNYLVEFFCDNNSIPFIAVPFPQSIAPGQSATGSLSFTIPSGMSCGAGTLVSAKIRPQTYTGTQCLCSESSYNIPVPLPVSLNIFEGKLQHCKALLHWNTATEVNLQAYQVERSNDGRNFTAAGIVTAKGNGDYDFAIIQEQSKVFYRLKMLYHDGQHEYSKVLLLTGGACMEQQSASIYPNPAGDVLHISIGRPTPVRIQLFNVLGQGVAGAELREGEGILDVHLLPDGLYKLVIQNIDGTPLSVHKVTIMK